MKVFIPVIDSSRSRYTIANGFSDSGSICVFDTKDNHVTWYESTGNPAGYSEMLDELKSNGVFNVIASAVSPMALKVFSDKGFTVYKSVGNDLLVNLELLRIRCLPIYGMEECMSELTPTCFSNCSSCEPAICHN
ncbi:NifB/NifX family molybdenum-iron cluster-binding protein [Natronoflexus pectinivorans]|uniref:Putative Fe-Mo cluster-binding NifX family protein n=1 Tax=Natronoflexus pectinivorans TaxID=682526 RepID=A0A4V2RW78_9BACT|nr:NifB/NifX family molybdenum-iron cluster-binding protein [Natronoflexus pectinivorans]TCO07119.1 putative Fe-Mo cluster-binding NifX family protein [Natronoflexus pectinivorans]